MGQFEGKKPIQLNPQDRVAHIKWRKERDGHERAGLGRRGGGGGGHRTSPAGLPGGGGAREERGRARPTSGEDSSGSALQREEGETQRMRGEERKKRMEGKGRQGHLGNSSFFCRSFFIQN